MEFPKWGLPCLVLLIPAACGAAVPGDTLSLERAINLALAQNKQLIQAGTLLATNQADLDAIESGFDVQVVPALSEQRVGSTEIKNYGVSISKKLSTGGTLSLSATRGDTLLPNGVLTVQPSLNLSLEQPLFKNAGSDVTLFPVHQAEGQLTAAKRKFAQARSDLVGQVIEAYANLHELEQQLKLDGDDLEQITELSRITQEYVLVGRAKTLDSMRTDFQLDETRTHLTADQQRLSSAQAALGELMGMPPDSKFVTETVAWPDYDSVDSAVAVQTAFANRLDYAQAKQDYDETVSALEVARNQAEPGIDLTIGYQRYSSSPLPGSGISAGGGPYIGLSSDIGSNYESERAEVRKVDAQREAALEGLDIIADQITHDVQQSLYAYQEARTENSIAEHAASDAEARLQLARELFHMGRADSFAVTDASEAVIASQRASLDADTNVVRAGYKLSLAMGTLVSPPRDLKPRP